MNSVKKVLLAMIIVLALSLAARAQTQPPVLPDAAASDPKALGWMQGFPPAPDKAHFAKAGYSTLSGWSYRTMWWVSHNEHGAFMARGIHGQNIYIDPQAEMVIVRYASNPIAGNVANDPYTLPAYMAVAKHLMP